MIEILSQLVRKPSKVTEADLKITGWGEKQTRVLKHMETDVTLIKLLQDFKVANDKLKYIRSKKDVKIYFVNQQRGPETYTYARCMFSIDGKVKEFRKYISRADEFDEKKVSMEELKETFLLMLKNFLEQ